MTCFSHVQLKISIQTTHPMKHSIPIFLACIGLMACTKAVSPRGVLSNDLSYTLICPDSVPTDGMYSWWTDSFKANWSEIGKEDEWLTRPEPLGYRGADFQRFYIHYDTVYKISDSVYHIDGKTRCKEEICSISGNLVVDSVVPLSDTENSVDYDFMMITEFGSLYAHYTLQAIHNDKHLADITGTAYFDYLIHNDSIYYDAISSMGDGYCNNQYTGKWIYKETNDTLACNWGDFRIPESYGLDGGCGEFSPYEGFYDNGWKTLIDTYRHGWIADPEYEYYDSIYRADINWWK